MSHTVNAIGHFDISGPDSQALAKFYAAAFAWKIAPHGPGYAQVETPDGTPNGAIVEAETPALTLGIVVRDIADVLTLAAGHGGRIVMPVTDNGWVKKAQIADPAGNVLTVIQA